MPEKNTESEVYERCVVKVRGINKETGKELKFPELYVVRPEHWVHDARYLTRNFDNIEPTSLEVMGPTIDPLDPRLKEVDTLAT